MRAYYTQYLRLVSEITYDVRGVRGPSHGLVRRQL
jgi:hypothetical protein